MSKTLAKSKLLNRPRHHSTAAIHYRILSTKYWPNKVNTYEDGRLHISDCNRQISIELDFSDRSEYLNTISKLNKILAVVESAKRDVTTAYNYNNNK